MKLKYSIMFLPILMCISLFSVGFASWVITTSPEVLTGSIGTEEVFSAKEYFTLESVDNLEYCTDGYVNNNVISNVGSMTLHYKVQKIQYFNKKFSGIYNSLNVKLKLTFNSVSYNIFKTVESTQSSSHTIISDYLSVSEKFPTGKINNQYIMDFTINYLDLIEEDTYDLAITFTFEYNGSDFNTIYNVLETLGENAFTIDTIVVGCANQGLTGGGSNA